MTNTRNAIAANALVLTSDGTQLGRVDITEGRAFKVDAQMQPDYWLAAATVMALRDGQVVVGFEEEHLDEFRCSSAEDASMVTATQVLVQMHGEAKALFRAILSSVSPVTAAQVWRELRQAIEVHERMEEQHLYGALQDTERAADLVEYEHEHRAEVQAVQAMITRTDTLETGSREWVELVTQIRDALEEHMHEEEDSIFPQVRNLWNDELLARAGLEMLAMKIGRLGPPAAQAA